MDRRPLGDVARFANIAAPAFGPFPSPGAGEPVREVGREGFREEWEERRREVDLGLGLVVEGVEVVESSEEDSPCYQRDAKKSVVKRRGRGSEGRTEA